MVKRVGIWKGFKNGQKKALIWPCTLGGTGTSKCSIGTEWSLPLFMQVVPVPLSLFFFWFLNLE